MPKPDSSPPSAPKRVPARQYMPISAAGANCATAAKLINPMLTSAYASLAMWK